MVALLFGAEWVLGFEFGGVCYCVVVCVLVGLIVCLCCWVVLVYYIWLLLYLRCWCLWFCLYCVFVTQNPGLLWLLKVDLDFWLRLCCLFDSDIVTCFAGGWWLFKFMFLNLGFLELWLLWLVFCGCYLFICGCYCMCFIVCLT